MNALFAGGYGWITVCTVWVQSVSLSLSLSLSLGRDGMLIQLNRSRSVREETVVFRMMHVNELKTTPELSRKKHHAGITIWLYIA